MGVTNNWYIHIYILLHGVECNMVRYCTSGLLYFTSQRRVKYSPQVQCLTILHSTPCNDKFINTKRDGYNMWQPRPEQLWWSWSLPYHFGDWEYNPIGTGIDAKRLWPRGRCQFSVWCRLISPTLISPTKNKFVSFRLLPTHVALWQYPLMSNIRGTFGTPLYILGFTGIDSWG